MKNKQFDKKFVPSRYLQRFFSLNSLEEMARYKLFPNIKEITESMSMFCCVMNVIPKLLPEGSWERSLEKSHVVVCGDGHTPRTAGLFAFLTKAECYSIDPQMREKDYSGIRRLDVRRDIIENFKLKIPDDEVVYILMPHSHAPIQETWDSVTAKNKWLITMPCCRHDKLDRPFLSLKDPYNISKKNTLEIYSSFVSMLNINVDSV